MDLVYEKGARIEEAFDGLRRIGRQQTREVFQEQLDVTEIVTPLIELVQLDGSAAFVHGQKAGNWPQKGVVLQHHILRRPPRNQRPYLRLHEKGTPREDRCSKAGFPIS